MGRVKSRGEKAGTNVCVQHRSTATKQLPITTNQPTNQPTPTRNAPSRGSLGSCRAASASMCDVSGGRPVRGCDRAWGCDGEWCNRWMGAVGQLGDMAMPTNAPPGGERTWEVPHASAVCAIGHSKGGVGVSTIASYVACIRCVGLPRN